jgi:hypothetical protein
LLDGELMAAVFPGQDVVRVYLDGRLVDAVFRLDVAEHERRQRFGLRSVCSPRLLRLLADLPPGVLVDDPELRAETALLTDGVVESRTEGVGRLLAPPVELAAVVVPAVGPARTRHVEVADRFAAYARRWVVSGAPRVDAATLVAASVRGVGLLTRAPGPEVVVDAGPVTGRQVPGKAWLLAEETYGAWVAAGRRHRRAEIDGIPATDLLATP